MLRRSLFSAREPAVSRARLVPDPERAIFQFLGRVERPHQIGLRRLDGSVLYDFRSGRLTLWGPDETPVVATPAAERAALETLVWNWEAYQRRKLEGGSPSQRGDR